MMKIRFCLTNFIVETFSGALNTLTKLHLSYPPYHHENLTLSTFKQLCAECVSLKTFHIDGLNTREDFLSHVSKLKKLENFHLGCVDSSFHITPSAFEQICTGCVCLKTLHLEGFETSENALSHVSKLKQLEKFHLKRTRSSINMSSFRGWSSSNMKELYLDNLTEISLQVR